MEAPGKRRRLSTPVRQRLSARSKLLQDIVGSSQHPYGSSSSTGAAFSNNGLVAYRVFNDAQTSGSSALSHPVTIAIRPLLAAWKVRPLLLQPPLSVHPDISYDIELLQFSPSSSTLIASIVPRSDQVDSATGLLCLWTKQSGNRALNDGWALTACWSLSQQSSPVSPFGRGILSAYWLPKVTDSPSIDVRPAVDEAQTSLPANSTQLPGMSSDRKSKAKETFNCIKHPSKGPKLLTRGRIASEGVLVIDKHGRTHLIHRDTSIHVNPEQKGHGPVQILTASLASSCQGSSYNAAMRQCDVSVVAVQPVPGGPTLLVAYGSDDTDRQQIDLTEVSVRNDGDEAVLATRQLSAIDATEILSATEAMDLGPLQSLTFAPSTSRVTTADSSPEAITLHAAFASPDGRSEGLLAKFSIARRSDAAGRGALSTAFGQLESKKRPLSELPELSDWAATMVGSARLNFTRLLGEQSSHQVGNDGGQQIRMIAQQTEMDVDSSSSEAEEWWVCDPNGQSLSINGFLRGGFAGSDGLKMRPTASSNLSTKELAASIAQAMLNRRSYSDILVAHRDFISTREQRRDVSRALMTGMGIASSKNAPPSIKDLQRLLNVQRAMGAASATAQGREEGLEADWTLSLIHAVRLLSSALRRGQDNTVSCDVNSVFFLLPILSSLIESCEALANESFLLDRKKPGSPPRTPPDDVQDSDGAKNNASNKVKALALLQLLTVPLLRKLLSVALEQSLVFLTWLESTSQESIRRPLVELQARRLAIEVRALELSKKVAGVPTIKQPSSSTTSLTDSTNLPGLVDALTQSVGVAHQQQAGSATLAVSSMLAIARSSVNELLDNSAIHYKTMVRKFLAWRSQQDRDDAASNTAGTTSFMEGWPLTMCSPSSDALDSKASSLARHLLHGDDDQKPGSNDNILKEDGLPLFLSPERDFVSTLEDVLAPPSSSPFASTTTLTSGVQSQRDALTFQTLPPRRFTSSVQCRASLYDRSVRTVLSSSRAGEPPSGPSATTTSSAAQAVTTAAALASAGGGGRLDSLIAEVLQRQESSSDVQRFLQSLEEGEEEDGSGESWWLIGDD